MIRWTRYAACALLALTVAGCSQDDEVTGKAGHTPASAKLFVNGLEVTPTLSVTRGQTTRIEIRFFANDGDRITGLEAGHFAGLTFNPATLGTVTAVAGQPLMKDVIGQAAAGTTGMISVGYGHDAAADELTFGPFNVTIH